MTRARSRTKPPRQPPRPSAAGATERSVWERKFFPILAAVCLLGLAGRAVILWDYLAHHPLADTPLVDALTYWNWAGRIADGQLLQDEPFFSAPLYPYLLGLFRRLGGTLTGVYVAQNLMDLGTAVVLAVAARRRFGPGPGLLAAVLYWLLMEPASFALRVLTCSLQLLLLALTYLALLGVQERPGRGRLLAAGLALGLLCLSYPPAMVLALAVPAWLFWQSRRRLPDALRALIPFGVTAACIAPATWHNWRASGDLFFIQSVTAVNLRQGNQPGSRGIYTPIPNTRLDREHLFQDVARQYALTTGQRGTWGEIDRYYRRLVFDFWRADPARTLRLAGRKLYYFLTSRNYGDIYQPRAELAAGLMRWLWLAPLPVPWLLWPALVGLGLLARRPVRHAPELLMFAIPLLLVTVFWFTPRYRLPALPVIVVVAAWMFTRACRWRVQPRTSAAVGAALVLGIGLGLVNRALGFDRPDPAGVTFHVALALKAKGNLTGAIEKLRAGLALRPDDPNARIDLGDMLLEIGRPGEALAEFEYARRFAPDHVELLGRIGMLLLKQQRLDEAEAVLLQARARDPTHPEILKLLGNLRRRQGDPAAACELYAQALGYSPADVPMRLARAGLLVGLGRLEEARAELEQSVRYDPSSWQASWQLGHVCRRLGDLDAAREALERARALGARQPDLLAELGEVYLGLGRPGESAACFRAGLALDPSHARCRAGLARAEAARQGGAAP